MAAGCGGNGNCCDNNNVGDSNINRMAAEAVMMMSMTLAAAAVATAVTMAVTMMVVAAVAEAASVAAPMVSAPQPPPGLRGHVDSQTVVFFPPKTPPRHFHHQKVLRDDAIIYICITLKIINTPVNGSSSLN